MRKAFAFLLALGVAQAAFAADRAGVAGPEERKAMAAFAKCVIDREALKAQALLSRDFQSEAFRKGLRDLAKRNEDCMKDTGHRVMATADLPLAAAMAETLIERGRDPLNVRLARAAGGKMVPTYSPSDAMAMCIARSMPDDVATLFASEIGSPGEEGAAKALAPAIHPCTPRGFVSQTGPAGLRAILATASYRLLAAQES